MVIEEFILWLEAERRYSPLTVRNYRNDIYDFLAWRGTAVEKFSAKEITRHDVEGWALYLFEERGLKASSVNRAVASLRSLWRWLLSHKYTERNIMASIRSFKGSRRLPVFVPDTRMEDVVARVRSDAASEEYERVRNAVVILLFYTAGLRLSELVAANIQDLSDDFATIRIVGKGGKERLQPIPSVVGRVLKKYYSHFFSQNICIGQKKALILSKKGERISQRTVQRIVDRVLKESGIEGRTSPHVLRHTFATHLLAEGNDLREIQELMGHSSLKATQVYTHLDITKLKEAYSTAHPRGAENED